jgi:hypothetical protein
MNRLVHPQSRRGMAQATPGASAVQTKAHWEARLAALGKRAAGRAAAGRVPAAPSTAWTHRLKGIHRRVTR